MKLYFIGKITDSDEMEMNKRGVENSLKRHMMRVVGGDDRPSVEATVKYVTLYEMMMNTSGYAARVEYSDYILFVFDLEPNDIYSVEVMKFLFNGIRKVDEFQADKYLSGGKSTKINFGSNNSLDIIGTIGTFNIFRGNSEKITGDYLMNYGERDFRIWHNMRGSYEIPEMIHNNIMEYGISFITDLKRFNSNDRYTYPCEFSECSLQFSEYLHLFASYCGTQLLSLYPEDIYSEIVPESLLKRYQSYYLETRDSSTIRWCRLVEYTISTDPWFIKWLLNIYLNYSLKRDYQNILKEFGVSIGIDTVVEIVSSDAKMVANYMIMTHEELGHLSVTVINNEITQFIQNINDKVLEWS